MPIILEWSFRAIVPSPTFQVDQFLGILRCRGRDIQRIANIYL